MSQSNLQKTESIEALTAHMRKEWDRRIRHDYRFWMSDGHSSDDAMWASGARDLDILTGTIGSCATKSLLEIGCGVGRLLKQASATFSEVTGIDVSAAAIEKARSLLASARNLKLLVGDGYTLTPLADASYDVVISFAALVSMPTDVVAHYLREIHRVLRPGGTLRIQIYLGKEQVVAPSDTLHLRCYDRARFIAAAEAAGFSVTSLTELSLPLQVTFKELGLEAMVAVLTPEARQPKSAEEISRALLPQGEQASTADSDLEYWMALNYAGDLAEQGDALRAKETLQYAATIAQNTTIDVKDLLQRITARVEALESACTVTPVNSNVFSRNFEVIQSRFPHLIQMLSTAASDEIAVTQSQEGPVLSTRGQCVDHATKPQAGADAWAKRTLQETRFKEAARIVVYGFGSGYHIEALQQITVKPILAVEPSAALLVAALQQRDLTACLTKLERLEVGDELSAETPSDAELAVRPQHQALFSEQSAAFKSRFYGQRGITALHPTIGVLGPIEGGTLPITAYTVRALAGLNQRFREYDMSGFASGFHNIDKFFFDKYRLAAVHGFYVEMLSRVLFEAVNEKPVDVLICMALAPFSGPVLTELRKRGVITVLWFLEDHLRFTYWKDVARYFDFVFTIQKGPCLEAIRAAGAGNVHYLPPGCDPGVHQPLTLSAEERARWGSPISFVGAGYHNRQQMFAGLADLPFKIWGTEWPSCRPFDRMVQEEGRRLTPAEYVKIFNATDINLNLHSSTERDGVEPNGDFVNPRTYELAAAGAFQLVDERTHLPQHFTPGKEVITFNSISDLKQKIAYYQAHPEERQKVAAAARERALREHTYQHRIREMLSIIYNSKYEQLKRKEDEGPWAKMTTRAKPHQELLGRCQAAFQRGEEPVLDALVADIVNGRGKLTETEQKLLFLYHVRKQIVRMKVEELGPKAPEEARRGGL